MPYDHKGFLIALGVRVRGLRQARGLSVQDIADGAGYQASYWRRIERGGQGLSLRTVLRLADIFDVTVSELLRNLM